ncbi:DUF4432 family protein [Rhizobium sp. CNPSo 3464]|uniref:DUF4432 family protein n=1 Tax=Rhizobium sp. CNPSo 3464 TaxID=3021406 RepID=UPI00254DD300|nr:DUF4432 family protein [Rhizobium sp. CNPSo 3464]MDK4738012.1 DUF4432 family protein [Rhizobium sp. CNPSo 3464]
MMDFAAAKGPKLTLDENSVLDIGACIVDGNNLAPGRAIPDDGDPRIDHSLEGFLFTCGSDHIRHPEPMSDAFEGKRYPLHGSVSSHPAKILWTRSENGNAECRADIDIVTAERRTARLERHWRIDGATGEVSLNDRVVNTSIEAMPVFLMYHMNIGGKWFDDGVRLSGQMLENGGFPWTFGEEKGGLFCVPATAKGEDWSEVCLGPIAAIGGKSLRVRFGTDTLPFLQVWRNQRAPAHVLGIEPVSHRLASRGELEEAGEFNILQPGEARSFALNFAFV